MRPSASQFDATAGTEEATLSDRFPVFSVFTLFAYISCKETIEQMWSVLREGTGRVS